MVFLVYVLAIVGISQVLLLLAALFYIREGACCLFFTCFRMKTNGQYVQNVKRIVLQGRTIAGMSDVLIQMKSKAKSSLVKFIIKSTKFYKNNANPQIAEANLGG